MADGDDVVGAGGSLSGPRTLTEKDDNVDDDDFFGLLLYASSVNLRLLARRWELTVALFFSAFFAVFSGRRSADLSEDAVLPCGLVVTPDAAGVFRAALGSEQTDDSAVRCR